MKLFNHNRRNNDHRRASRQRRSGIILLVVLAMLTFFSVMAAAYLVFSNQNRQTSFAIATRNIKQPNTNAFMEEALMMLIRGTGDGTNPFFGEDLLSDYYGRKDATSLTTNGTATAISTTGFVRIPINTTLVREYDDVFAGRIITFLDGPAENRSYRVLRSISSAGNNHDLIIELEPDIAVADITLGLEIWINGRPRNSAGLGFDGTNISQLTTKDSFGTPVGYDLPVALQPNHLTAAVDKSTLFAAGQGDFDESYDAADFNNWFLSYRQVDSSGKATVIPSFHRPSVINYILNEEADWQAPVGIAPYDNVMASIARATMRPLPIYADQFGNTNAINEKFTGGNANFALRIPMDVNSPPRLDQIAKVLTGSVLDPYDVDNDGDGETDSIWVDIRLPVFTSPEGRLIKPLVAVMIEDLGGRLNVNAHSNYALVNSVNGLSNQGNRWAGLPANPFVFRGLGFGPAEINIPAPSADALAKLVRVRYLGRDPADDVPGAFGADALSVLTSGWRPGRLVANSGYSASVDPYGRGGVGISDSGNFVSVNSGVFLTNNSATTTVTEPDTEETKDNPYEFDPAGKLGQDQGFSINDIEAILRSNEFDGDLLSGRLRTLLESFRNPPVNMDLWRTITTISRSDAAPNFNASNEQSLQSVLALLIDPTNTLSKSQLKRLIAPELRLGNRLNVNLAFGNGIDDTAAGNPGKGVIDEPGEYFIGNATNPVDSDGDGDPSVSEADEMSDELEAFASHDGATIDSNFTSFVPKYDFDELSPVDARQLLARHLYVLMMTLSDGLGGNNFPSFGDTLTPAVPVSDRDRYRARRIAQWAVNVVDYRDPDSIMTAFEYDEDLSNGWNVPGADSIDNDGDTLIDEPDEAVRVVFGVENPELVFTESMALHDVRVRDTNFDSSNKAKGGSAGDDEDTDQMRIPQGSLFLELYCPRERLPAAVTVTDPESAGVPAELYNVATAATPANYAIELDRTVTTHFDDGGTPTDPTDDVYGDSADTSHQVPVWRIAISEPHFQSPQAERSPLELRKFLPDTLSFEPSKLDELGINTDQLALQRFVFFTNYGSVAALRNAIEPIPDIDEPARAFFNFNNANVDLLPEQYLSLAPRTDTYLGSTTFASDPTVPSGQSFSVEFNPSARGLIQRDLAATRVTPDTATAIQPGLGVVIAGFAPFDWTAPGTSAPEGIGLNVSEPIAVDAANYYTEPDQQYTTVGGTNYPLTDAYVEIAAGAAADPLKLPLDQPEDIRIAGPIFELTSSYTDPAVSDPMLGSFPNYRTAFLQRLADPTRGFHPVLNPYRTVDQIAIDLTIFSGEDEPTDITAPGQAAVPTEEIDYLDGSRQRDGIGRNGVGSNILYSYSAPVADPSATVDGGQGVYFAITGTLTMDTTFNYLNAGFGMPRSGGINRGRPAVATPFAMHPWLNRPFASPYELMLVPACSQARLFEEFSVVGNTDPDPAVYPDNSVTITDPTNARIFIGPYRHLLNFFHSSEIKSGTAATTAEFGRLFDLVGTPAPFRGELEPINPSRIASPILAGLFSAPFNMVDDNNRVGRINLNTLVNFNVWRGLMQGHMNPMEYQLPIGQSPDQDQLSFEAFLNSRRGFVPSGTGTERTLAAPGNGPYNYVPTQLDPRYPTQFAGVLKASYDGQWAPSVRNLSSTSADDSEDLQRRSASASLLRGMGTLGELDPSDGSPPVQAVGGSPTTPAFVRKNSQKPAELYNNRLRNPYLRYQTLMRMPNLVSDNSQVYLIRMTMGFFEVDAANINSLGAEYGANVGRNQRYQAMFIVDRSIPVGFIPGQDLNARDVVIFESYGQ